MADALGKVAEHKRALEEAEKIEKEFMTLMTGQRQKSGSDITSARKNSSTYEVRAELITLDFDTLFLLPSVQEAVCCFQECNGEYLRSSLNLVLYLPSYRRLGSQTSMGSYLKMPKPTL